MAFSIVSKQSSARIAERTDPYRNRKATGLDAPVAGYRKKLPNAKKLSQISPLTGTSIA
jgi:hypothetical protein